MDISLNALPLNKMRAIITCLEDLNIGITSARLDKSISQTQITFKSESADIDRDTKAILRVLRSYAVYKKQMPTYSFIKATHLGIIACLAMVKMNLF